MIENFTSTMYACLTLGGNRVSAEPCVRISQFKGGPIEVMLSSGRVGMTRDITPEEALALAAWITENIGTIAEVAEA